MVLPSQYRRLTQPPKGSFFLFGVRGVGKSTWARAKFPDQTEVDFLLRRGREYLAVEIKAQSRFSHPLLSGLRAIADLPRVSRRVLVYLGDRRLRTEDGIEVWPLRSFLDAIADERLWP
jgi:predicted AAA+ superfamily ATPase